MPNQSLGVYLADNKELYSRFLEANGLANRPLDAEAILSAAYRTVRRPEQIELQSFSSGLITAY